MAFGRSNSLSINTGASNSLFGQQSNTPQPQTSSLFGGGANNAAGTSAPGTGGLFGTSNAQPQAQQGNSLFGGTLGQSQTQNAGQSTGGGLFGGIGQNQTQKQSVPGDTVAFAGVGNSQAQQKPVGSMFGGFGQQQSAAQPAQTGGNLFGGFGASQAKPAGTSLFGVSTQNTSTQPAPTQQSSLLGASLFNNPSAPLAGSLTMGQSSTNPSTVPGVKIDLTNIRPTTRFSDLHDDLKRQIESLEAFIRQQESYASQCEALLPSHSTSVASLAPDVGLITSKAETVELGLENDGRDIAAAKDLLKGDVRDLFRCVRVIENQALPARFHYGPSSASAGGAAASGASGAAASTTVQGEDEYDVDLLGYFTRQVEGMGRTKALFDGNMAEIEAHLGVVERRAESLVGAVQRERYAGGNGGGVHGDTVRELADTLRGFEEGILDAARKVGGAREGVEGLVEGQRRRY